MNDRFFNHERGRSEGGMNDLIRTLRRSPSRNPVTSADLVALQRELRAVRERCLEASRRGDYLTQGRLTVEAARLNEAISQAQQVAA
jgi:hypothetical protein